MSNDKSTTVIVKVDMAIPARLASRATRTRISAKTSLLHLARPVSRRDHPCRNANRPHRQPTNTPNSLRIQKMRRQLLRLAEQARPTQRGKHGKGCGPRARPPASRPRLGHPVGPRAVPGLQAMPSHHHHRSLLERRLRRNNPRAHLETQPAPVEATSPTHPAATSRPFRTVTTLQPEFIRTYFPQLPQPRATDDEHLPGPAGLMPNLVTARPPIHD